MELLNFGQQERDEYLMWTVLRAIIDMVALEKFGTQDLDYNNSVARNIAGSKTPLSKSVCSAVAGNQGAVNRGRGEEASGPLNVILSMTDRYDGSHVAFHHEVLWAICEIYEGFASLGQFKDRVHHISRKLLFVLGESANSDEALKAVQFARKLLAMDAPEVSTG